MKKITSEIIHSLIHEKDLTAKRGTPMFCGVGAMGANQFIHISALLGIIPLVCYGFAEIHDLSLGPAKVIQHVVFSGRESTAEDCNQYLQNVHSQFSPIWNNLPTENLFENTLCICHRSFVQTTKHIVKLNPRIDEKKIQIEVIKDDKYRKESRTKDVFFMDEKRGHIQNVFCLRSVGKGCSVLRPSLVIKIASKWDKGDSANVVLTNWCNNADDRKMSLWEHRGSEMSLLSKFRSSSGLDDIYKLSI